MSNFEGFWAQGDAVTRGVALLLLLMSVSAWVLILWNSWTLRGARRSIARAVPAFWDAADLASGRAALQNFDAEGLLLPCWTQPPATPAAAPWMPPATPIRA